MQTTSSIKRDRFFVIKTNNLEGEYFTLEDALLCKDKKFVILDHFKEFFTPNGGFNWRISNFNFINDDKTPFNLSVNSWTIQNIDTTFKSSSRIVFEIVISDPTNRIRRIKMENLEKRNYEDFNLNDLSIVKKSIETLNEYSKYLCWEQLDLEIENNKLKNKITQLESQIDSLIKKNN